MNRLILLAFVIALSGCFSHLDLPGVGSSDYASSRDLLEAQRINALKEAKNGGMSSDCKGPSDCRQLAINGQYYGAGGMVPIGSVYPAQAALNGIYSPPVVLPGQQQVVLVNGGQGAAADPNVNLRLNNLERRTDALFAGVGAGQPEEPKKADK